MVGCSSFFCPRLEGHRLGGPTTGGRVHLRATNQYPPKILFLGGMDPTSCGVFYRIIERIAERFLFL